jgi:hypothetical protein
VTVKFISGGFQGYETNEDGDRVGVWYWKVNVDGWIGYNGYALTDEASQDYFGVPASDPSIKDDIKDLVRNWLQEDPVGREGGMASLDGTPTDGLSVGDDSDGTVVADGSSTDGSSSDGTAVTDGSSTDGSSSDGTVVADGSPTDDGGDGHNHTGTIGEST